MTQESTGSGLTLTDLERTARRSYGEDRHTRDGVAHAARQEALRELLRRWGASEEAILATSDRVCFGGYTYIADRDDTGEPFIWAIERCPVCREQRYGEAIDNLLDLGRDLANGPTWYCPTCEQRIRRQPEARIAAALESIAETLCDIRQTTR